MTRCCSEPTVEDLLADRAMRLLMARDGVQEQALRELLDKVRRSRTPHIGAAFDRTPGSLTL